MTRTGASIALALTLALSSCSSSARRGSSSGGSGGEEETGGSGGATGGSTGTGGKTSTGGSPGTGGSTSTGGSTATGGSPGTGGSTSTGGSTGMPDAGGKMDLASAWPNCLEPVFSGVAPAEFCMVYANVCTFTGTNHYASMADCMAKFKGMSNDGDACKSGHLCRAATMPSMKDADCASSGTASCKN